jgi:peptidoglycan/xylan/chitin deacetylase (PgdA/CDA1 family)
MIGPRLPERTRGNRAVTPFFKVFGGNPGLTGEASRRAGGEGYHRLEWRVLSVLVPLVSGAAVFDGLWRIGGSWLAWTGVVPVLFVLLHVVTFVVGGSTSAAQWWRWCLLISIWALWQLFCMSGSSVEWIAHLWIGFLGLNVAGGVCLAWQKLMTLSACCTTGFRWLLWLLVHIPAAVLCWTEGWLWGVGFLFGIGALWACGTFLPNARIFGPVVSRMEGEGVLLTFDDGPDPADTPVILDLLDTHGQKAVFFVIGEKVRRFPELAREIVRRGHELGNHTMTHPVGFFWGAGSMRTRREIADCSRAIEEVTGIKPRWFRAPAGHRNWFTHPILKELGLELMGWRKRAYDTIRSDVPGIVSCLTKDVRDGDILLLHEATPIAEVVTASVLETVASKKPRGSSEAA